MSHFDSSSSVSVEIGDATGSRRLKRFSRGSWSRRRGGPVVSGPDRSEIDLRADGLGDTGAHGYLRVAFCIACTCTLDAHRDRRRAHVTAT